MWKGMGVYIRDCGFWGAKGLGGGSGTLWRFEISGAGWKRGGLCERLWGFV